MTLAKITGTARAKSMVRDFAASIVVFLVAMPLCMGIALASGVSPEKGLITGVIGGIIVGALAGSPLQVSGPAAGLAVIVFEMVREHGVAALGPILVLAGAIQLLAGIGRLGGWFRAISPAVVHGMLAGIGALICIGQLQVLFDRVPQSNGIENLMAIPAAFLELATPAGSAAAFAIGVLTIVAMLCWERLRPHALRLVPGALIGVILATVVASVLDLQVARVAVPESLLSTMSWPALGEITPAMLVTAVAIAFIASAETLLSAAAVDRMHDGVRTDYNKELRAQGVGNLLCGVIGALPMTGVIVRSSANVQAGATTRASTMLHGAWILLFAGSLPWLLRAIPMATLAGVLVVTGWRLVSLQHARHLLHHYGALPAVIWAGTLVMVVATDLLMGVLTGLALSLLELLPRLRKLRLQVRQVPCDSGAELQLEGSATFITLPRLAQALDALNTSARLRLNLSGLHYVDHTCAEVLTEWIQRHRRAGRQIELIGVGQGPGAAFVHRRLQVAMMGEG